MPMNESVEVLRKAPTGIQGLDEITYGGLPQGRPTLLVGSAGSGKTMLGMRFLVHGATECDEPGVFVSFEESEKDLTKNFSTLGVDVPQLVAEKKITVDYVYIERSEIEETGEYDLEGLFVRLGFAIDSIGAKRVVLDTLEALFSGLTNAGIVRAELRRLFRWLKDRGVTAVITAERGETTLSRYGLEEYVADCVILLDMRTVEQVTTRRLRIIKYRGSAHGTNEYPFIIDKSGITVLPITSIGLAHEVSDERISSGIPRLDAMLGARGYYRASTILVSGGAGTGKTSLAAAFVDAAGRRGERCLYFAFEESPQQIMRNMRSIGIDLQQWVNKGLLVFHASRPTLTGLETHLTTMIKAITDFRPTVVVVDPITNLTVVGSRLEVQAMLTRMVDYLKSNGITALFTSLTTAGVDITSDVGISSLIDTWISVRNIETEGERNRGLFIMKSRGMEHSNQVRELVLSDKGVDLRDVYLGPTGVLTGTARIIQEAKASSAAEQQRLDVEQKQRELEHKRRVAEAQIAALQAELDRDELERQRIELEEADRVSAGERARSAIGEARGEDTDSGGQNEHRRRQTDWRRDGL